MQVVFERCAEAGMTMNREWFPVLLATLLLLHAGPLPAHEIAGGNSFMCKVQGPEEFNRADKGNPVAQYDVGNMLDFCQPEDPEGAAQYFLRAAQQGHIKSTLRIGRMYMFGIGVGRNDRQAYFWLSIGKRLFDRAKNPPKELGPNLEYVEADLRVLEKDLTSDEIVEIHHRVARWKPTPEKSSQSRRP
jgi:hypothetical protein